MSDLRSRNQRSKENSRLEVEQNRDVCLWGLSTSKDEVENEDKVPGHRVVSESCTTMKEGEGSSVHSVTQLKFFFSIKV